MRPIETLLLVANALTFFVFLVPLPRVVRPMRYMAPVAVLLAIAQMLIEGLRWQMAPAYALSGLFFLAWSLQNIAPKRRAAEQKPKHRLAISLAAVLGGLALALSIVLPTLLPVFRFPKPGGPYAIGTATYHWTDASRREVFSVDDKMCRELIAQVWYPAKQGASSSRAPYLQDSGTVTVALARLLNLPGFSLNHLRYVATNAVVSVPVAADQPRYPVLIYLEGLTGYRQQNTFQVEELVSHGYIVVGIDQPGAAASVSFPDGHQIPLPSVNTAMQPLIHQSLSPVEPAPLLNGQTMPNGILPYFAQDVSFALDQLASLNNADPKRLLTGKLDLPHTGVFGMSLGGMVGAEACLGDPRIKACLIEDVAMTADVVQQGLQQPSMWITRPADTMRLERQTAGGWAEQDIVQTQTTMHTVYNSLPGDGYFVQVPGMFHIDFTDLDLLSPILPMIGFSGPIGAERAHTIVNAYSVAFFDKHLNGAKAALLDGSAAQFPDVIFEMRRP